jgi:hypothetical protein
VIGLYKLLGNRDLEGLTYPKAFDGVSAKYYEISPDGAEGKRNTRDNTGFSTRRRIGDRLV